MSLIAGKLKKHFCVKPTCVDVDVVRGVQSMKVLNSRDVVISGVKSVNSELYHVVIDGCEGVAVQDARIVAPGSSPNTDGIHVQSSSAVTITGASIQTGDDCISVGPGTSNLRVEHVSCGPGHGISIGSLGKESEEGGVENVTVSGAAFVGTENGLRIKTWGRAARSGAYVRGVVFEHALMRDVSNPIIIDQSYCPNDGGQGCPHQVPYAPPPTHRIPSPSPLMRWCLDRGVKF